MLSLEGRQENTAAETALALLRHRILDGDLEPGTKLNQSALAAELGMSRIPVRDAIRALASEGLVSHDPHRTAVVAPLSAQDLAELYELRMAVEPLASAHAVSRLGDDDLAVLAENLEAMARLEGSTEWLETHDRFHASLYRLSGRPRMIALLDRARAQTRRYTWLRHDRNASEIAAEHRLIYSAVRRRDAGSLRALIVAHLTTSHEIVRRELASHQRRDSSIVRPTGEGGDARRATA